MLNVSDGRVGRTLSQEIFDFVPHKAYDTKAII